MKILNKVLKRFFFGYYYKKIKPFYSFDANGIIEDADLHIICK